MLPTDAPALWGGIGGCMYAGPKMLVCIRDHPERWLSCIADLVVAVLIGAGSAAAFGPALANWVHRVEDYDARAISTAIGLLANPISPRIQQLAGDLLERWAKGKSP